MSRDKILEKWVEQPPAEPNVQYLRDAERITAWEQVGPRSHVLDIASESNVTDGLEAESITRVDFSSDAIEHAKSILEQDVDRYQVVDPETPSLPFDDEEFDAAVCIGPYDWKFLDIRRLTNEVRRVLQPSGKFVFSVPTPRSPYSVNNRNKYRYYTPDDARNLVSSHWQLADCDLIYQYPYHIHYAINILPNRFQRPFVTGAWSLTDLLTSQNRWEDASYLVLGLRPFDYKRYLRDAIECLFRPTAQNGFWDRHEGKFIRALTYERDNGKLTWDRDDRVLWRYAPFALMGVLQWRNSSFGSSEHDHKIRQELDYFLRNIHEGDALNEMPSYGIGPLIYSFSVASELFDDDSYRRVSEELYEYSRRAFDFDHAEDSLLLYGWTAHYELFPSDQLQSDINDALWQIIDRLTSKRLFQFENETTRRHQNQMYTLWGLCRAIEVTGKTGYLDSVEQVLDYTIQHRMQSDGAFIWEDVSPLRKGESFPRKVLKKRPPHWEFLYECHQTFFVNAVSHYYRAGGTKNYDQAVRKAMGWIFGNNTLNEDLVNLSGIGVPMRQMTTGGRMNVSDQMYKGSYEVGSYLMALTNLRSETFPHSAKSEHQSGSESAGRVGKIKRMVTR